MNWNNKNNYVNNTKFEWGVFAAALVVLIVSLATTGDPNNYIYSALLYTLTGAGMISKTVRAKGIIAEKTYKIWILAIGVVFLAAALTIITEDRKWNFIWLIGILTFSLVGRKKEI